MIQKQVRKMVVRTYQTEIDLFYALIYSIKKRENDINYGHLRCFLKDWIFKDPIPKILYEIIAANKFDAATN